MPFFWYPGWSSIPIWNYFLIVTAFAVMLSWATNLARFGVIPAILMHAVHNTSGRYFNGLFADADPGSGGFLPTFARIIGHNITMSFGVLIGLGAWASAIVVIPATRGRLGYDGRAATR